MLKHSITELDINRLISCVDAGYTSDGGLELGGGLIEPLSHRRYHGRVILHEEFLATCTEIGNSWASFATNLIWVPNDPCAVVKLGLALVASTDLSVDGPVSVIANPELVHLALA